MHNEPELHAAQRALTQSRRRLLGASILLLLACGLIPWMLDSKPRAWGDDVVLSMPQLETPYQAKPDSKAASTTQKTQNSPAKPNDSTIKESKP